MVATNWLLCHFYTLKQGHVGVKHTYIPDGYFCGEITQYNLVYEVSTKDLPAHRAFHIQKKMMAIRTLSSSVKITYFISHMTLRNEHITSEWN